MSTRFVQPQPGRASEPQVFEGKMEPCGVPLKTLEAPSSVAITQADVQRETWKFVRNSDIPPDPRLPESDRSRLIRALDRWDFQPQKLPDEEVLTCTIVLFEALWRIRGMQEAMESHGFSFDKVPLLLAHLQSLYRYHSHHSHQHVANHCGRQHQVQNPYHNFAHALDVLQSTYIFLRDAGRVPAISILLDDPTSTKTWSYRPSLPSTDPVENLQLFDLFVIYIVAVGHDVGHPGFANSFMKRGSCPLGVLHKPDSPLEALHTSILLETLKYHGLSQFLTASLPLSPHDDHEIQDYVSKMITKMIMVTDMCVHKGWIEKWNAVFGNEPMPTVDTCYAPALSDYEDTHSTWVQKVMLCQGLIKCADISNPTRPHEITVQWSSSLIHEWISQAYLEDRLKFPEKTAPMTEATPYNEACSQVFFMETFSLPLFQLVGERILPCLARYSGICQENLKIWRKKKERYASSTFDMERTERQKELNCFRPRPVREYTGVFALCLPPTFGSLLETNGDPQSDSDSTAVASESNPSEPSTSVSTPTSPRSPVSPPSELTPPSSPTSSVSASSSSPYPSGSIGRAGKSFLNSLPGANGQNRNNGTNSAARERMGLRIGTSLADCFGTNASGPNSGPRRKASAGWGRKTFQSPSSVTSSEQFQSPSQLSSTTSTTLLTPSTPLTSPPPVSSASSDGGPAAPQSLWKASAKIIRKVSSKSLRALTAPASTLHKSPSFKSLSLASSPKASPPSPKQPAVASPSASSSCTKSKQQSPTSANNAGGTKSGSGTILVSSPRRGNRPARS